MNSFWLFGSKLEIIGDQDITGTSFDIVAGDFPPGAQSPLHVHTLYSETLYVVSGQVTVFILGKQVVLNAGQSYFIPENVPHCVVNTSQEESFKALAVASTNGFAKLIRAVGIPVIDGDDNPPMQHDMELAMQVMAEIGDQILAPPGGRP